MLTTWRCASCKGAKPAAEMRKDKGRYYVCKACHNERRRSLYRRDSSATLATNAKWAKANKEWTNAYTRQWRVKDGANDRTKRRRVEIANLSDSYVRQMFCENSELKHSDIPQCMVEARRELIKLKRAINEKL
jgi:hypothetical protein